MSLAFEGMVVLVRMKMAVILPGLRASTRPAICWAEYSCCFLHSPRSMRSRRWWLSWPLAQPLILLVLGLAGRLCFAWPGSGFTGIETLHRHGCGGRRRDVRLRDDPRRALELRARRRADLGVFFGSAYGSMSRVLIRTTSSSAVVIGQGLTDAVALQWPASSSRLLIVAFLMHGMVSSIGRYEKATRREQVLAATGLDLVAPLTSRRLWRRRSTVPTPSAPARVRPRQHAMPKVRTTRQLHTGCLARRRARV